jgi:hypothetical protein
MGAGEPHAAVTALVTACDQRDPLVMNIAREPRFVALHAQPRFADLMARLALD